MPAVILHQGVVLMALDRLRELRDRLQAKIDSGLEVTPIDRQVQYLAKQAVAMMTAAPQPTVNFPARPFTTPLGIGVSGYAVMGSLGPALPAYSALMAPGQTWAANIMRGATPDSNRAAVHARSIDFIFEFWKRAETSIAGLDAAKQRPVRDKLRAYVLGHFARIASEALINPYIDDVTSHFGSPTHAGRMSRNAVEAALDAAVAQRVFLSTGTRRGAAWSAWWPAADDVPSEFYEAYAGAFQHVYLSPARPLGFKEFEEEFTKRLPPDMSPRLVRDGYSAYRGLIERGYDWTWGDWALALLPLFLPAIIAMPLTGLLTNGKDLLKPGAPNQDKAWGEALAFPLSATALVPLIYSIYIAAWTSMGVGTETVIGIVLGVLVVAAAVVFFSTIASDVEPWVRIVILFGLPIVLEVIYFIWVMTRGGHSNLRLLGWAFLAHAILATLTTFGFALFRDWISKGVEDPLFWLGVFLWLVIVGLMWAGLAALLKDSAAPELPADDFGAGRRHYVRLIDDGSLHHSPTIEQPTLGDRFHPSGRRKLLQIWWEGSGEMHIRPRRHSIEFSIAGNDAAGDTQIVLAPIAPMSLREFAAVLKRTVKDAANAAGGLRAVPAYDDEDYDLPPGEVFADHADIDDTIQSQADHDTRVERFVHLGKTNEERKYFLMHAPRSAQSVRFGPAGPKVFDLRRTEPAATGTVGPTVGGGPNDVDGTGTRFLSYFRVGDAIEAPLSGRRRTVTAIISDVRLTTVPGLAVAAAGTAYKRIKEDRTIEVKGAGQASIAAATPTRVSGSGPTLFTSFFMPGDKISVGGNVRNITALIGDSTLTVDTPFPATAASDYFRMPTEFSDGYELVPSPAASLMSGESIMDHAANLAVLFCLGATTHLLTDAERTVAANAAPAPVNKVVQVFRNWNLDERRLNEWKMLVAGDATSEKRGAPQDADRLLPDLPDNWTLQSGHGEPVSNKLGWVPLLRRWADVARRPGESSKARVSLRPGDPTNLALSRALAYLLDMPDPDPAAPAS